MTAPYVRRKHHLWIGIIVSAALLLLSAACASRSAAPAPPQAPLTSASTPAVTPGPLKLLKVSPEEGPVGSAFTVTGDGLPSGKAVDLVWVATDDTDMPHVKERFFIGSSVTNAKGGFTASLTALVDHGEFFDIYAIVDGENLAKGGFRVPGAI